MATAGKNSSISSYGAVDVVKNRPVRFSSLQLQEFTNNYADKLGAGGFGVVYRGQIQYTTQPVAVKVLDTDMGRRAEEQFMAEIGTIGRTSHVNLVRLYGFCFDAELKALVYEFMPNGSLDHHLFHSDGDGDHLSFEQLYEVAVGTAKAVRYLHDECERRIIHYDIKPGNVLLDESFRPKVADFGLARLCERERTHMTITGGGRETDAVAARALAGGKEEGKEGRKKVERMCAVALWCVQYRPDDRPSMSGVVRMLEGDEDVAAPAVSPFVHLDSDQLVSQTFTADTTTTFGSTT
nr:unnamed protein product [Digitaria exilis]